MLVFFSPERHRVVLHTAGTHRHHLCSCSRQGQTTPIFCNGSSSTRTETGSLLRQALDFCYSPMISLTIRSHPFTAPHQHQQIKRQRADIRPHCCDGTAPCVNRWRTGRKRRKDDAGQRNDQTLQADARIAAQKFLPTLAPGFACKGRQRHRRDGGVHPKRKHPPVNGQHHDKGQHRDEQTADERDRPQRDALPKSAGVDGIDEFLRQRGRVPMPLAPAVPMTCEIMPCTMSNTASIRSMPKSTAALANTKRINSLRACSGFLTSTKLPQVLTTPAAKKQHEQPIPNGLQRAVDAVMTAPHRAAVVADRAGGQQLPDLGQLVVPGVEGVGQVIHDPVIVRIASPPSRQPICAAFTRPSR